MSTAAYVLTVSTHGVKGPDLPQPYWLTVLIFTDGTHPPIRMPAVVDDFGSLVIVGGPL